MPNNEELMDIVGQTISERKQGDVFFNSGADVRIRATTSERNYQPTLQLFTDRRSLYVPI